MQGEGWRGRRRLLREQVRSTCRKGWWWWVIQYSPLLKVVRVWEVCFGESAPVVSFLLSLPPLLRNHFRCLPPFLPWKGGRRKNSVNHVSYEREKEASYVLLVWKGGKDPSILLAAFICVLLFLGGKDGFYNSFRQKKKALANAPPPSFGVFPCLPFYSPSFLPRTIRIYGAMQLSKSHLPQNASRWKKAAIPEHSSRDISPLLPPRPRIHRSRRYQHSQIIRKTDFLLSSIPNFPGNKAARKGQGKSGGKKLSGTAATGWMRGIEDRKKEWAGGGIIGSEKRIFQAFEKEGGIGRGGGGQSDFFFLSSDLEIERGGAGFRDLLPPSPVSAFFR